MPEVDAHSLVDQLIRIGLVSHEQYRQAKAETEDSSGEALIRILMRKGWLTSWQLERLKKNDPSSFFYGGYRALFHLAEGTFARVYRGQHDLAGSPVAIKVLRHRFASMSESVERFHKEAEAGMRLWHPNIVRLLDQGQQDNRHYMIMEYVEGMNLREFLRLRGRLNDRQAVPLMLGLARGLEYSHSQGVTHRDLKATNILISNSGTAKLVDFGLATIEGDDSRHGITSQRTIDYSALERTCLSPKGDPRSDIFFMGCVYYHMLTGQVPLQDSESTDPLKKMLKRGFGAIKPIGEHHHAPPLPLVRIIEKMMKMDLKSRYQNIQQVVADLEDYQVQMDSSAAQTRSFAQKYEIPHNDQPAVEEEAFTMELLPEEQTEIFAPDQHEVKAPTGKTVLCVESQVEIQHALREYLTRMGYHALLASDAQRAAECYREAIPQAVIFDADGLGDHCFDALRQMHEKAHEIGYQLVGVILLSPRQEALRDQLPPDDRFIVLFKPLKLRHVQDAITKLLPPD